MFVGQGGLEPLPLRPDLQSGCCIQGNFLDPIKSYLLQPNLLFEIRDPDHIISTNCPCTELIIVEEIPHPSLSHTVCTLTRARDVFGTYRFFVGVTGVEPVTFRM